MNYTTATLISGERVILVEYVAESYAMYIEESGIMGTCHPQEVVVKPSNRLYGLYLNFIKGIRNTRRESAKKIKRHTRSASYFDVFTNKGGFTFYKVKDLRNFIRDYSNETKSIYHLKEERVQCLVRNGRVVADENPHVSLNRLRKAIMGFQ